VRVRLPAARLGRDRSASTLAGHGRPDAPPTLADDRAPGRRGRVLIVADEPALATALRGALASRYDVEIVGTGAAVGRVAGGAEFDAILCDVLAPEVAGVALYRELARIAPAQAARVVFLTGAGIAGAARDLLARAPNPALARPFSLDELLGVIAQVARA
jgi:CheY-like chemotaxis protein